MHNANASVQAERSYFEEANNPLGIPVGINPGRVVWAWKPDATNENCKSIFDLQDWYGIESKLLKSG